MMSWWGGTVLVALVLAGCSSGGGSGDEVPPAPNRYDDLAQTYDADFGNIANGDIIDPADVTASGSATYQGVAYVGTSGGGGAPLDLLGNVDLTVTFGSSPDPVSGQISGFHDANGNAVDGRLVMSDSEFYPGADVATEWTYITAVSGTLTAEGIAYDFDGGAGGDFYRDAGGSAYIYGYGDGAYDSAEGGGTFILDYAARGQSSPS